MKKLRTLPLIGALCALVLCLGLVGCGGDNSANFVGTWEMDSMEADGVEYGSDEIDAFVDYYGDTMTIELEEGGDGTIDILGTTADGTWEAEDASTCTFVADSTGEELTFELEDGLLGIEADGTTVFFARV